MMSKISPFAPTALPLLPGLQQVFIATDHCGIKYKNRDDVCLMVFPPKTSVAGVFTNSLTASAPVLKCRQNLQQGEVRAIIINAGNSNAFTGKLGDEAVTRCLDDV
ncbi:MAG TPA: bifunctional ornithine acetyltransferase/N-acetylglutamate synthase, partial [Alphaproteobacteria bacterium]|nr:bifunctional ornithine acetyltransferase/N-acetylglutamate synthase [Alphaproteobacteria bacterium]